MLNKNLPSTVVLAILSTITVFVWIGFEIYQAATEKPNLEIPKEVLLPLDPSLDQEVLDKLEDRITLNESQISDTTIFSEESIKENEQ